MTATPSPLIGITTYGRDAEGRFALPAEYVDAVRRAGGMPVLLPPGEALVEELIERFDGFVLSGGGDVDPALYGGDVADPRIDASTPTATPSSWRSPARWWSGGCRRSPSAAAAR